MAQSPSPASPGGSTSPEVLVAVRGLSKRFGATQALDRVDLDITAGSVLALLGQNGAGKSTLIKILAGVYTADAGEITVCGTPQHGTPEPGSIAFIHQDLGLVDDLTVAENIALGTGYPRRRGLISWPRLRSRAVQALELAGSTAHTGQRVAELSRTEKSLVAIARALVTDSRVLVLDEPTASLPVNETDRLFTVIRRLRDGGLGLVYVSHRLDEVFQITDRLTVMRDGRVVASGAVSDTTSDEVVLAIVGRTPNPPPPPQARDDREVLLELDGLVGTRVGPASLKMSPGEVVGLVGLAGAGQSELGRTVAGILPRFGGAMRLCGREFAPRGVADAIARGVGFVTSNRADEGLAMPLTATENLFPNPALHGEHGLRLRRHGPERRRARELAARFGVRPDDPDLPVEGLSGGNQQKVIIGRWLSTDAQVLVLEEPTAGVDVGAKNEIYQLLDEALRRGIAVLLISTDVEEIATVSHRALVFRDGLLIEEMDRAALTTDALVAAVSGAAA